MIDNQKRLVIYTDGACEGNPGPGGYGVVILDAGRRNELSGGFRQSTNNRMEIYAAIKGLEVLKGPCQVTVYSDSEYLVNAMTRGWAQRWKANHWKRNKRDRALNVDLWERMLTLCQRHEVEFVWVKGHAGLRENERCDQLSMEALKKKNLPIDEGYENSRSHKQFSLDI